MPLLVALSPAPVLTTDGTLLRSTDPVYDIALYGPEAKLPSTIQAPPRLLVQLFAQAREDEAFFRISRGMTALAGEVHRYPLELRDLEASLETLRAQFDNDDCIRDANELIRRGWWGRPDNSRVSEQVIDKACERQVAAFNATILEKINKAELEIAARKAELDAFTENAEDQSLHQVALSVLLAQQSAVTWSRIVTFCIIVVALILMLVSSFGGLVSIVFPLAALPMWFALTRWPTDGFATRVEPITFLASLATVEALLLGALALRTFLSDNADIWKRLRIFDALGLFGKSLVMWLPLGAFVVAASLVGARITKAELELVYQLEFPATEGQNLPPVDPEACEPQGPPRLLYTQSGFCDHPALERDIRTSTRYWFDLAKKSLLQRTEDAQLAAGSTADSAVLFALEQFDLAIPSSLRQNEPPNPTGLSPAFNLPKCKWYEFFCHGKRRVLKSLNRTYVDMRKDMREGFEAQVTAAVTASDDAAQAAGESAKSNLPLAMDRIELEMTRVIWTGFRGMETISALSLLLAVIAILKSYGFVLGRVFFSSGGLSRKVSMGRKRTGGVDVAAIAISDSGGMSLVEPGLYRVVAGADVDGIAPSGFRLVQPHRQTLKRLLPFRHFFQSFTLDPAKRDITLPCGNVHRIIAIPLKSGDTIGYFPKYLHGFSGTPVFASRWSFRIAHLLQARIRICTVEGPCTIFLKSSEGPQVVTAVNCLDERASVENHFATSLEIRLPEGETPRILTIDQPSTIKIERVSATSDMNRSDGVSPGRLMAWSAGLDLDVSSGAGWTNIYTASIRVKPFGSGFAVFDGPTGRNRLGGALTFIPGLFLPI